MNSPDNAVQQGAALKPATGSIANAADSRDARVLVAAALCYTAFNAAVPLIPEPHFHHPSIMAVAAVLLGPTLVFMWLQLWLPWTLLRIARPWRTEALLLLAFGAVWGCTMAMNDPVIVHAGARGLRPHLNPSAVLAEGVLSNLAETLTLTLFGALLSRIVREAKILVPLGVVAGIIDVVGAMTPLVFTNNVLQHHPDVVHKVSVSLPHVRMHGLPIVSTIGPGDPMFVAFFFAIVLRERLNTRWTLPAVYVMFTLSMIAVQIGLVPALGALMPLAIAVILTNYRYFRFSREENFAMLYAVLIALVGTMAFFAYAKLHMYHHH